MVRRFRKTMCFIVALCFILGLSFANVAFAAEISLADLQKEWTNSKGNYPGKSMELNGTTYFCNFGVVPSGERKSSSWSTTPVPFPVSWTVKMKKKQKETQDILSYHTQAAGCSDKARAKASGGRQPIEECGRTGL